MEPFHLVAENSAAKDHSAVLRADLQAAAYPPGCPHFWGDLEHPGSVTGMFFTRIHLRDTTKTYHLAIIGKMVSHS